MSSPVIVVLMALWAAVHTPPGTEASAPPELVLELPAVEVALLSPGDEPREPLRYRFEIGRTVTTRLRVERSVSTHVGTELLSRSRPIPIELDLAIAVQPAPAVDTAAPPRVELIVSIADARVIEVRSASTADLDEHRSIARDLVGRRYVLVIDDRGSVSRITQPDPALLEGAAQAWIPDLARSLASLLPLLPAEPVGVNASWSTTGSRRFGTLILQGSGTTTLKARQENTIALEVRETVTSRLQRLPMVPLEGPLANTHDPRLVHGELRAAFEVRVDLSAPFTLDGRAEWSWHHFFIAERGTVQVNTRDIGFLRLSGGTNEGAGTTPDAEDPVPDAHPH